MAITTATTNITQTYSAPRQLSDENNVGTILGQATTDLVGFYGAAAGVTQPSAAGQAAIPNSGANTGAGNLRHYTSTQSPGTGIATITTSEQSITVTGVLSTDMVILNKPTSQTGLSMCDGRVSAANTVKLVFVNTSAGTLTPTGSEAYVVTTIPTNLQLSAVLSPASVAAATVAEQTFTVTGLDVGMVVAVNKPTTQTGLAIAGARVSAKNTLALQFVNPTAAAITPTASETYQIFAANGLVATSQIFHLGMNIGTVATAATATTTEISITAAGVNATDVFMSASKPTLNAGIGIAGGRVASANTIALTYVNATAANVTPTASEVYDVTLFRPAPAAPMSILTPTLTPVSVAANTSAEQTFTVSGLVSGNAVVMSPPSTVTGLAVTQVRISATNTLAVTYTNVTANAIVPPAGVNVVGQFNMVPSTAGNFVETNVTPLTTLGVNLMNATRAAMVSMNMIAGA